jgi:hypothetical protein
MAAGTAQGLALRASVVGNGATPSAGIGAASKIAHGTVGQAVVGESGNPNNYVCHGFWCEGGPVTVAVDPPAQGPNLPRELSFSQPRPNPARHQVSFELALPREADVRLAIYDLQGREMLTMVDRSLPAGYHKIRWDGTDVGKGGSGIYFGRLLVDGRPSGVRRIIMLR